MKKQKISNEKLDSIGTMLIEAGRLTPDDIDRIAARPGLFACVHRGIELERRNGSSAASAWSWRSGLVLVPAAASVLVVAVTYFALTSVRQAPAPSMNLDLSRDHRESLNGFVTGDLAVKQPTLARRPARQIRRTVPQPQVERQEGTGDFYALTYDNDLDSDVRLIRAELPRSALVAMGLNLHLENGNEKVQTDLLVGADGVPRAIRIVK